MVRGRRITLNRKWKELIYDADLPEWFEDELDEVIKNYEKEEVGLVIGALAELARRQLQLREFIENDPPL